MTNFTLLDAVGLAGVVAMLIAYGATVSGRMDPLRPVALGLNLAGSLAVLLSLTRAFNWSAAVIESAWAVIAAAGLVRWFVRRRRIERSSPACGGGGARRSRVTEGAHR